ncbi:hypothetical protein BMR05_02805 [Methylococcaceae bacterium HT4]|uniref:hypothetical protein n=1 Tax=Bathymodiolus platifrons methanotrophic gill symbiont TaxID=113268 RepID=UPI000B41E5F4|nr:hypothetical protein [Bathymodiolus platifrons methanotrophic gill symbiont]TXL15588.1 hypothetical protein BMR05_02805 [Methylococcaceae bacterium HT4]
MTTYNKQFELSIKDIDLIERSLRFQISHLASTESSAQTKESIENHNKISGSRYFCESLFWASQPKQAAKT